MANNLDEREFGSLPEEISVPDPALEFSPPPPEYPSPGPEIVEPGSDPMESGRQGKGVSSRFYTLLLAAVITFVLGFSPQPLDLASRKQTRGHAIEEGIVITETAYRAEDGKEEQSESGSEETEGSQEQSQTSTEEVAYTEPECEIVLSSMASEMIGLITFNNMDDVALPVTLEYWDPETETMVFSEEIEDISEPIPLNFTTEHFYDANQAYYDAAGTFPMEAEVRVRMNLGADGEEERVFTQQSIPEEVQWWVYYDNSTESGPYSHALSFVWMSYLYGRGLTVVYNHPELVTEESQVISLLLVVDGEADPGDTFSVTDEVTSGDVYTTEGYTHYDEIHDITALIARDMFDAPSHTAILYVTTYLEGYDRIVTIPIEFRFSSSSG